MAVDQFLGQTFGHCKVKTKLGQGGMGAVYSAHHQGLNKTVAIKVLTSEMSSNKELIERFIREARSAAKLEHPNIVQVFDIGLRGGIYYIVMQYVDGTDLHTKIAKDGPMGIAEATSTLKQSADAIAAAHKFGIIHRDIKPSNIMFTPACAVKVADFGLAKSLDSTDHNISLTGQVVGTPYFMSPEQAEGKKLDGRSDIYSLGATYYYILTGQVPYNGDTPVSVILKHIQDPIPEPKVVAPHLPDSVCALIKRMMAKKPEDRPQSMEDVAVEAQKILRELEGVDLTATSSSVVIMGEPARPFWKTKQFMIGIGAGVVLMVVFLIIVSPKKKKQNPPVDQGPVASVPDEQKPVDTVRPPEASPLKDTVAQDVARIKDMPRNLPQDYDSIMDEAISFIAKYNEKEFPIENNEVRTMYQKAMLKKEEFQLEEQYTALDMEITKDLNHNKPEDAAKRLMEFEKKAAGKPGANKVLDKAKQKHKGIAQFQLRKRAEALQAALLAGKWGDTVDFFAPEDVQSTGKQALKTQMSLLFTGVQEIKIKDVDIDQQAQVGKVGITYKKVQPVTKKIIMEDRTVEWKLVGGQWYIKKD